MSTARDIEAAAVAAATRDVQPVGDDAPEGVAVRLCRLDAAKPYAESSWLGFFTAADALTVTARLVGALDGRVVVDTPYAITVTYGQRGEFLSTRQVAERAGLAESSVRAYRSRGQVPPPDGPVGGGPGWLASTIDPWIATLPGQGARTDLSGHVEDDSPGGLQ